MSGSAHYREPKFLSELAYEVAELESVSKDLKEADLTNEKLVEEILKEPELSGSIEHAISGPVAQADRLEQEIDNLRQEIRDFGQSMNSDFGGIADSISHSLSVLYYILSIVQIPVMIFGGALAFYTNSSLLTFTGSLEKALGNVVVLALIFFLFISFLLLGRFMARPQKIAREPVRDAPRASRAEIGQRIKMATAEQDDLKSEIPKIVRDEVLTPIARKILERLIIPSYELFLQGEAAPLGEVWDPRYETETKPRKELERQLSLMSGGSIGISGSRGAGKTTLIKYFCRRSDGKSTSRKRPVLGFWTPAPARYEARDFVLHLFGKLCEIVRTEGVGHAVLEDENRRTQTNNPALLALLPYTRAIKVLGILILFVSTIGLIIRTEAIVVPHHDASLQTYPVLVSRYPLFQLITPVPAVQQIPVTGQWADIFRQIYEMLGVNLGLLFLVGCALWVIGGWAGRMSNMKQKAGRRPDLASEGANTVLTLTEQAKENLDITRFQRSFTSGWSGSLNFPLAFAGSTTLGQSRTENPESLPEIIERYTKFVSLVQKHFTLFIGIDELDKLKSDEEAERFLNEIKVLFGLEGCYYFVSISESALARFERRGLPLRDTFDSSFDEVLHVGYVNTEQAIALLRRRIPRLPVPFICFCHCLAGGLPRDIIRACRSLYVTAEETKEHALQELSNALMQRDFYHKCRAMALSAKQLDTDYASDFLIRVNDLEDLKPTVELFDERACNFFDAPKLPESPSDDDRRLAALCREFGSYLLYCATLLALFGYQLDVSAIKEAKENGLFDRLAKARQSMTVDPKLSWYLCIAFRKSIGLSSPSLGAEPQPVAEVALTKSEDLHSIE